MTQPRTWKLQINLDDFNAGFAALDTEADRSDFLLGLSRGMNRGRIKDDCSDPMAVGFAIGEQMRADAEAFRAKSQDAGKRGQEAKSNKNEPPSQPPLQGSLNQSLILNPQSNNQQPSITKNKRVATKKVITSFLVGEESSTAFGVIWDNWPKRSDGVPSKGNRGAAQKCFQAIVDSGEATAQELVKCFEIYCAHPNVQKGIVKMVSTFFSLEAGTWVECLDIYRSRRDNAPSN